MFCSCKNHGFEKKPNTNVCPICLGHPGSLPVINKSAIEHVLQTGKALNCKISKHSKFDRKNYFYPDLPKGYQISQYDMPLCKNGYLIIQKHKIRITRIHLEEDTGKLIHPRGSDSSLIDFNRSGVPLMELVTEPDIHSAKEAREFCRELQLILRYLKISNADMEKGEMRCEVNISIQDAGTGILPVHKLGTKVEIKNLNSFKAVENSINYEIKRQSELLNAGEKIVQETRGWDDSSKKTISQRSKEQAHDYRYFPEPDLPPLQILDTKDQITDKELPNQRRKRFKKEYGLLEQNIEIFIRNPGLGNYFEDIVSEMQNWVKSNARYETESDILKLIKLTANYILTEFIKLIRESGHELINCKTSKSCIIKNFKITPENFAEFIYLIHQDKISSSGAQTLLKQMFKTGGDPSEIIKQKGLTQISDESSLAKTVEKVVKLNNKALLDYKAGKDQALKFLIGQVMKETKGKANPKIAEKILKKIIKN